MIEQINESTEFLKRKGIDKPVVGVVLGTGLGRSFLQQFRKPIRISYSEIPHFPLATVESHQGALVYGEVAGKMVIAMQGRFHYYEGYDMKQVTFPIRVMKQLGVKYLLISNAGGMLNPEWNTGELMLIDDHINLQHDNPLRGKNIDALGPRFPDMSRPYDQALNGSLLAIAERENIVLRKGVYVCVPGPNLETRAEYRFLRQIGADAVGMSTVPEVIVANHMTLPCCAISVMTDDCDPDNLKPITLQEIIAIADRAEPKLTRLFAELIASL